MNKQNVLLTFLNFFQNKGYNTRINKRVINNEKNNLLFVNSGIVGIINEFQSCKIDKLATAQNCLRIEGKHNDYKNIGQSTRHMCNFTMLGTFANHNVNLENMIAHICEFLQLFIPFNSHSIHVTVHPKDTYSPKIWCKLYPHIPIVEQEENTWCMGKHGLLGYSTEIMYKQCDNKMLELWNIVVIDREVRSDGKVYPIPHIQVDTGGGLERIYSAYTVQNDIYLLDHYLVIIQGMLHYVNLENAKIILDSILAINSLLNDNAFISNKKRGYILKKLFRRLINSTQQNKNLTLEILLCYSAPYITKITEFTFIYTTEKLLLNRCKKYLHSYMKRKNNILNVEDIIYLHQTHGIHYQFTLHTYNTIQPKNTINEQQITDILFKQQHQPVDTKSIYNKWNKWKETIFTYNQLQLLVNTDKIIFIQDNQINDKRIITNTQFTYITEKTIFYPTSGGQEHDQGVLIIDNIVVAEVYKVKKIGKQIIHYCKAKQMILLKQQQIKFQVDKQRRLRLSHSHTIQHIIMHEIEKLLNSVITQESAKITTTKTSFTFSTCYDVTKLINIQKLEDKINTYIRSNITIKVTETKLAFASRNNIKICYDEEYNTNIRCITIQQQEQILSREACCGTHIDIDVLDKISIKILEFYNMNVYHTKLTFSVFYGSVSRHKS